MQNTVFAQQFVPPPAGPYQSSLVIGSNPGQNGSVLEVYRFPPAELLETPPESMVTRDEDSLPAETADADSVRQQNALPAYPLNQPAPAAQPGYGYYGGNQWKPQTAAPMGNYYGGWNQAPYSPTPYPNYYNYNYSNPYQSTYGPFNDMPAPWDMMPGSFFSGR